jgi:hypothetical protein
MSVVSLAFDARWPLGGGLGRTGETPDSSLVARSDLALYTAVNPAVCPSGGSRCRRDRLSFGHFGVSAQEFELDSNDVVEALASLVDVVMSTAAAVYFAASGFVGDA